MITFYIIKVPS